jgi:hypothetical protein
MSERFVMVAMHARARLWEVLSERMCELAALLAHVEAAELESRETMDDGTVRYTHRWRARANVPGVLAQHIDQGLLEWTTDTEWRSDEYASRWVVRPRSMKGAVLCEGTLAMFPAIGGRGTRVEFDLAVVARQPSRGWTAITGTILVTHFRKLIDAASRLLEEEAPVTAGQRQVAAMRPARLACK